MNIKINDISVQLNRNLILDHISLTLENRETVALLGLNGAGKTTLIKTITGHLRPMEGNIFYGDEPLSEMTVKKRSKIVSYVPQMTDISFRYTVEDFVAMGNTPYADAFGSVPHGKQETFEALEMMGIQDIKDSYIDEISGGELRSAYLARCRVQKASWMILDEPLAGLDYKKQHVFMGQIREYVSQNDAGVLLSIHDPMVALNFSDRLIIIDRGRIIADISRKEDEFPSGIQSYMKRIYGENICIDKYDGKYLVYYK